MTPRTKHERSPTPSSEPEEDSKPLNTSSSPVHPSRSTASTKSTPKKAKTTPSPGKAGGGTDADTEGAESGPRERWTPEKKKVAVEMMLEAGYGAVDFDLMSQKTGLTKQQLRDALKRRQTGKTNLRTQLVASVVSK